MLNEEQLKELPEPIIKRLEALNTRYLTKIGQHINDIGQMSPTDIHRLVRMKDFGVDVDEITKELERITAKNAEEIHSIYHIIAEENFKFAEKFMGDAFIPYAENAALQAYVTAAAAQTVQTYVQMSKHTAFYVFSSGRKVPTSLGETYTRVIDQAITAITTGTSDYYTEMRGVMKDLADSGIRTKYKPLKGTAGKTADYATGYSRRLDTAIRQNILWGVKELNQGISEQLGKEFGADGWEIDYHAHPRPTHEGMGGKQYAIGKAEVINGRHYKSFSEVEGLLSEYGCLHLKFPIILGVSEPTYTDKQLDKFEAEDKKTFEFEGKHYTKYKASQVQRKLETSARHAKDRQIIAKAAGDDTLRRKEQERINLITSKYAKFSKAAGLPTKAERMRISKYHRVKEINELKAIASKINKFVT